MDLPSSLLSHSRLSQDSNGSGNREKEISSVPTETPDGQGQYAEDGGGTGGQNSQSSTDNTSSVPTSGQKWWAAVLLGLLFAVISSPMAYEISNVLSVRSGGPPTITDPTRSTTLFGLLVHTIIFILIVRLLLW